MSVAKNKALVRRFVEQVLAGGDLGALNALAAPGCVDHAAPPGQTPCLEAIAHFVVLWCAAFPDLRITIEDLLGEGDRVAVRSTLRGTHRGEFFGLPATDRRVTVTMIELYRLASGQIVERRPVLDTLGLLHQLGAGPSLPPEVRVARRSAVLA